MIDSRFKAVSKTCFYVSDRKSLLFCKSTNAREEQYKPKL